MSAFLDAHNFLGAKLAWQQSILSDHTLTDAAKIVGCQLMHDLHSERRCAWRSQDQIALLLGKDRRTVQRALAHLVKAGHLEKTTSRGRGHANTYRALIKGEAAALGAASPDTDEALERAAPLSQHQPQKAAPVSHYPPQKAAPVTPFRGEKAAPVSIKGGAGAAPYLDNTNNTPPTPQGQGRDRTRRAANCNAPGPGFVIGFPDADVRAALVGLLDEPAVRSWLDPAGWRASDRTIVCRLGFTQKQITERAGRLLKELGVRVIADAAEHSRLRSAFALASAA